jgi:hypothetical protein
MVGLTTLPLTGTAAGPAVQFFLACFAVFRVRMLNQPYHTMTRGALRTVENLQFEFLAVNVSSNQQ